MSFIDKFLDITINLPREVIRYLNMFKEAEKKISELQSQLKSAKDEYKKTPNNSNYYNERDKLLATINKLSSDINNLIDYKLQILNELNYIICSSHIKKSEEVIKEGEEECKELLSSAPNSHSMPNTNSIYTDDYKVGDFNPSSYGRKSDKNNLREKKKLLDRKRNNSRREKNKNKSEQNDYDGSSFGSRSNNKYEDNKIYCKCKKNIDEPMIECENEKCPYGQWFHYSCVGIVTPPDCSWFCCSECREVSESIVKNNKNKDKDSLKEKDKPQRKKKRNSAGANGNSKIN